MSCPNINLESWKLLVSARGEGVAYYLWDKYDGNVPESESNQSIVKSGLKATNALQSDKAIQLFSTLEKNKVKGDAFWNKIQTDLQIPKEQIELLKQYNTTNREELITNMLADYSYAVEINIAKALPDSLYDYETGFEYNGIQYGEDKYTGEYWYVNEFGDNTFISEKEYKKIQDSARKNIPSQYYSNLTVPGGTNYTENEIATPAITPSIKGHAQFATDKGIGWFRSDDKKSQKLEQDKDIQIGELRYSFDKTDVFNPYKRFNTDGTYSGITEEEFNKATNIATDSSKTRRILEVQSDLFQKGRDKKSLTETLDDTTGYGGGPAQAQRYKESISSSQNQFLQLLNKGGNWVTFFVKSIIQDSSKKGYEKVLFPSGNTASKVEGHTTLEGFKKQKQDRIKELEEQKIKNKELKKSIKKEDLYLENISEDGEHAVDKREFNSFEELAEFSQRNSGWFNEKFAPMGFRTILSNESIDREINQLKQELERVEKEGLGALKPIYNFYQNTVTNVLNKQYGKENIKQVTDEYGNTWNELTLVEDRDRQAALLQLEGTEGSKASPETIAKIKQAAKKMGISIQDLADYAKAAKLDTRSINGVADLVRGVIAIASGREDTVLTEEMVHLATAILEQTNPALVTSMISKIDRFQIYKKTLKEYSGNKDYQLPNGKPDIRKIKKEAVDRLIAEVIINQNEGDTEFPELMEEENRSMVQKLWETIKDYIKGIYGKTNIDIFQEAARQIMGEEAIGTVADIKGGGVFYQLKNDLVDNYYNKIMDVDGKTELIPETTVNGVKIKRHYLFDGIKVLQSVTEKIKQKAGKLFSSRTDLQKKMDEFKKNWGTEGHNFIQNYITNNLIDKDGYARKDFLDVKISTKLNETIQDALKGFSEELIRSYAPGTRFIIEKRVVNQKVKGMIASTVDFKAIEPVEINGKKDIRIDTLDWKFTGLDPSNKDDLPWYKQSEWKEQMGEYTKIDYSYGAKPEQIRKTRMIPFIANYKYNIPGDSNSGLNLDNIEVGKLDSLQETRIYLLPVALNTESTGNAEIDKLLKSLRTQYEKLYKKSVLPQEKFAKTLQLNEMSRAIRSLHMKLDFAPLAAVGKTFLESAAKAFKSFENVDYSKLTVEDINKKLGSLLEFKNSAEKFEKLDAIFRTNFSDKEMTTEDKNVLASIEKVASSARRMKDEISKLQSAYVVQLGLIQGLTREETKLSVLNAQREVKGIFKSFAEASKIPNHIIRLSANLWMNAKSLVSQKIARDITDFGELLNPLEKEASAKGKSAFDLIGRVEDDGLYLIQKLSKKFMADVALAKEEQNKKFLLANIDIDLYNKLAKERIDKGIEEFQNTEFSTSEQQDYEIRESKINKLKDLLDINRESFNGYNDYEFSELFSETLIEKNHYSSEYKEMAQSKAALDVWNLFTAMNKRAKQMGYLSQQGLSFFPLMEASALQKLSQTNDFVGQGFDFFRDAYTVKVNEEQSFSKTDPETGRVRKEIPKLFTRTDKDVSQLSRDLNRVGTLWIKSLAEYENRKNTEHILLTLLSVERAKPQIAIDAATGETIWEGGVPQTIEGVENKNADLLEAIIDDYLYGLREDASSIGNVAIGTISKKLSDDEETSEKRALAAKKVLQNGDKLTQSLAVGLKLLVTIPNYVGFNMQAFINSGNFYTFAEFTKNNVKLQVQMSTIEKGLIDLIVPLNEDITKEKGRELAWKQSPVKWLGTWTFNDVMMVTNSFPEKKLQIAAAMSMNDNSMVINGKIVNIRQYLKKQDEARYKKDASGKYIMSESERRALEKTFESRVKELKATSALAKIAKIENGYVVIPGVSSEELAKYRTMIVENIRNLNGQMSEENKANYRRDTIFKSFMMFKNWIPKQVMLRGSNINKNLELNQWEYGRTRLFVKTWAQLGFRNIFKMQAILQGTDEGLAIMDEMLKAKKEEHFKRTGEELDITDEEFYDMVRRELSNQMKELGVLLGVMSLLIAAKVAPPPDDKDKLATNRFKYFLKLTHKISDEIAFYYNPLSFESMTKGSVLPALGLLTRAGQFIGALEEETRGRLTGDQELQDKNHPVKYFFNMVPVGNQFQNDYLPYFAPDLAKENGIRVSPEARR